MADDRCSIVDRLRGKVCIITGAGGSIGAAAAERFSREGAHVVGCDISATAAEATVEAVRSSGGSMVSLSECDLRDPAACDGLVELATRTFGRVDAVFNVAATAHFDWLEQLSHSDFTATLDGEINIVFNLTKAAWPELKRQGGAIINLASVSGWIGYEILRGLAHSAGKGAILSMTRHLAMEGRNHGIRVNSISPGLIETGATEALMRDPAFTEIMLRKIMLGRAGQPHEVAAVAAFLASDDSSFITATDIRIDGGTTAW